MYGSKPPGSDILAISGHETSKATDESLVKITFIITSPGETGYDTRVVDVAASSGITLDNLSLRTPENDRAKNIAN